MAHSHSRPPSAEFARRPDQGSRRSFLGLGIAGVVGLALLAVPRLVLHDLGIIQEGTGVNAVLTFLPPLIWIAVVLVRKVPNPFLALSAVGACYGVFLALGHQLMWNIGFDGSPPQLGGNLAGLDPLTQQVIIRFFAVVSGVITGVIVGVVTGLVAWLLSRLGGGKA